MIEIKYKNLRNSLINLPNSIYSQLIIKGVRPQSLAVIIRVDDEKDFWFGWSGFNSSIRTLEIENLVEIDPIIAQSCSINESQLVSISLHTSLPIAKTVNVIPNSADDWEILETNADYVQDNLLSQVRVASPSQPLIVYLPSSTTLKFNIESTDPPTSLSSNGLPAVLLGFDTEVIIAPKLRKPIPSSEQSSTIKPSPSSQLNNSVNAIDNKLLFRMLPPSLSPVTQPGVGYISKSQYESLVGNNNTKIIAKVTHVKSPIEKNEEKKSIKNNNENEENVSSISIGNQTLSEQSLKNVMTSKPDYKITNEVVIELKKDENLLNNHINLSLGLIQQMHCKEFDMFTLDNFNERDLKVNEIDYDILNPIINKESSVDILPGFSDKIYQSRKFILSTICKSVSKITVERDFRDRSLGLLVTGDEYSGKTTFVDQLKEILKFDERSLIHNICVDLSTMAQEKISIIRDKFKLLVEESRWHAPSLIILDNVDSLIGKENESQKMGDNNRLRTLSEIFVQTFSPNYNNLPQGVGLIGICNSSSNLNPLINTTHVFGKEVKITPPNKNTRKDMIEIFLRNFKHKVNFNINTNLIANESEGYLAIDLKAIIERAIDDASINNTDDNNNELNVNDNNFHNAIGNYKPTNLRNVKLEKSEIKWDDIGGMKDVKRTLRETFEYPTVYSKIFKNCPLRLRSGVLLYGYPGCGKTLIASAIAKECNLNFISIKGPELLNKYIGASESATRECFERASAAKPCILFFDEFESIATRRGHDSTGVTDRVVNQMLTQMDGAEGLDGVYVLAATSRPDLIDPALLRPGRLDKSLLCDLPNTEDRLDIIKTLLKNIKIDEDIDLRSISDSCNGFTGADLQALVYNAKLESIHEEIDKIDINKGKEVKNESNYDFKVINNNGNVNSKADESEVLKTIEKLINNNNNNNSNDKTVGIDDKNVKKDKKSITQYHFDNALKTTNKSLPTDEYNRLNNVYIQFSNSRGANYESANGGSKTGSRSSLA